MKQTSTLELGSANQITGGTGILAAPAVHPHPEGHEPPLAVIVDIDGTLAIRREGKGQRGPFDWDRVGEDLPNRPIINLTRILANAGRHRIILFSGRMEQCRGQTTDWLSHYGVVYQELHMRPDDDYREDFELKAGMYRTHVEGNYIVEFVLDDRNQVVDMWRNTFHLTCLQVAEGDF